jgi:hypothetical protein
MFEPEDPDLDEFFHGAPYLEEGCVDCPPPLFLLPPPPRPPHLSQEDCPLLVSSIDTCDNILIVDSQVRGLSKLIVLSIDAEVSRLLVCPCKR